MEAKFRGKRIGVDEGEWVEGWYLEIGGKPYIRTIPPKSNLYKSHDHFIEPDSVKMWTGLKDRNGVEMYEGDIIRIWSDFYGKELPFSEIYWNIKLMKFDIRRPDGHYHNWLPNICVTGWFIEIIGNTTDNPELLKD